MQLNKEILKSLREEFGDAFYLLDCGQVKNNYMELKEAFTAAYHKVDIAYSYKTNYIPKICSIINQLGGFAEVVSDMEMEIALKAGVCPNKIIWNGPYKNPLKVEELLLLGGTVNMDSISEVGLIHNIANRYPDNIFNIGIRVNFPINDHVLSRFGFDVETEDFKKALHLIENTSNLHFANIQCHYATRRLETWEPRAKGMIKILDKLNILPDRIDLGGGLFGKMEESLKKQFDSEIPTYADYANVVGDVLAKRFTNGSGSPSLMIEPGTALVGDCMKFVSTISNIKTVRKKPIATLLGSIYNVNPTLNTKNPPIEIYSMGNPQIYYEDLDFGGFTCIESDYIYKHYCGKAAVGDMAVFSDVGSYSVVLKPPFILPNFPIIGVGHGQTEVLKRAECFDDLFCTYKF